MTADEKTRPQATPKAPPPQPQRGLRVRMARIARRGLLRMVPPYARHRARQAAMASTLGRLEADFEHVRKRQTEQIERLEDLVRELVQTTESLRRAVSSSRADAGEI
jgi:hypothetical protein